jgi:hypothetical protein
VFIDVLKFKKILESENKLYDNPSGYLYIYVFQKYFYSGLVVP